MISNISEWAKAIIIAVMCGTVLEMIIPEGKNKKYIKVVIGVYILFCIINPVIGKSLNFNEISLDKYISNTPEKENTTNEKNNNNNVNKLFKENMKKQIKNELNINGYDSDNINITTDSNYNITQININNIYEYKENKSKVNKIEINIKDKPAKGIAISDKEKIIDDFVKTYQIDRNKIIIN